MLFSLREKSYVCIYIVLTIVSHAHSRSDLTPTSGNLSEVPPMCGREVSPGKTPEPMCGREVSPGIMQTLMLAAYGATEPVKLPVLAGIVRPVAYSAIRVLQGIRGLWVVSQLCRQPCRLIIGRG